MLKTAQVLQIASDHLLEMGIEQITFDLFSLNQPKTVQATVNLTKIISKLSPLLGNFIEFNVVECLNQIEEFSTGKWERQDPGFPDAIFRNGPTPEPGIEIKAWFPFATEMTARFRDSQTAFSGENINVAIIAWLPEFVICGRPKVIASCVVTGKSIAEARDAHYHKPPDYLVIEPNDTSKRTKNLQQSNTAGYKLQETHSLKAREIVSKWGADRMTYSTNPEYQAMLQSLKGQFNYRLDTNYAKIDRIGHKEIELFKRKVQDSIFCGQKVSEWTKLFTQGHTDTIISTLQKNTKLTF